jgi:putative FmdB family regulatory protein
MPTYDTRCTHCNFAGEIQKPRDAALPACPDCGHELRRVYRVTAVQYAAPGFTATDGRLEKIIGRERFAKFQATKADVEARARAGRLTPYERAMEMAA